MAETRTEGLLGWDREHIIHPVSTVGQTYEFVIESARGITLRDTDGKEYLDLASQLTNVNLGHSHEGVLQAAKAQMDRLVFTHTFSGQVHTPGVELGQKLATIVPPGLDHFMWTQTGSDSNDTAFRLANLYWRAKGKARHKIISLNNSYHGVSRGVAGATTVRQGAFAESPPAPSHVHIPNYFCYRCPFHKEYPSCGIECAKFLAYTIENEGPESVAAFIAEPEQGAGGAISPPDEYWPMVRDICSSYGVLLIADEVMTGFCRTGRMFGFENWPIRPDIITMSKGIVGGYLPFGAVAVSKEIHEALMGSFMPVGSTQSGNPVCCALASACIDVYVKDNIAEHARRLGEHLTSRLKEEFIALPHVGDVGGLGLMLSLGLVVDKKSRTAAPKDVMDQLTARARDRGLYLRLMGGRVTISPPLIITQQEADRALDILYDVIAGLNV